MPKILTLDIRHVEYVVSCCLYAHCWWLSSSTLELWASIKLRYQYVFR